jgi:hypothetical protein
MAGDIRVTARPHPGGIDINKLALVLLETVNRLSANQVRALTTVGEKLLARAEAEVKATETGSAA